MKIAKLVITIGFAGFVLSACGGQSEGIPPPTTTSKLALTEADSCEHIRDRVIKAKTEKYLRTRFNPGYDDGGGVFAGSEDADVSARPPNSPASSPSSSGASSPDDFTETNVQFEGVDEADIIKTNGDYVYAVREDEFLILKSWPPEETEIVGRQTINSEERPKLPSSLEELETKGLFVKDDKAVVFAGHSETDYSRHITESNTWVTIFDLSSPSSPNIIKQVELEGKYTSARMINGQVYLVSNSSLNLPAKAQISNLGGGIEDSPTTPFPFVEMSDSEKRKRTNIARQKLRRELRRKLSGMEITELLPDKTIANFDGKDPVAESMHSCKNLYLPPNISKTGVLSLSKFDLTGDSSDIEIQSTGLLAEGLKMYASKQNLYVAHSNSAWDWGWRARPSSTRFHKFKLSDESSRPDYEASGRVDGSLLNQFSMSEHDGYFRVATTSDDGSHVTVLEQKDDKLEEVGAVRNLAPGERIYSVRMMGDKGYVVTFERIDPLFTLDLSDPQAPEVKGELKITGFSTYIHPLGDSHLMTIGRGGTSRGVTNSVQLQIFDVGDMNNPIRIHKETIAMERMSADSEALGEHHAFTYDPEKDVLAFPISIRSWERHRDQDFSGLMLYDVNAETGFKRIGTVNHSDLKKSSWRSRIRRSLFIEDFVYSYGMAGLKVNELQEPGNEKASITF